MTEKEPTNRLAQMAVIMMTLAFGFVYVRGNFEESRPMALKAAHISDPRNNHKVESRLWQDPFEPFSSTTNAAGPSGSEMASASGSPSFVIQGQWSNAVYKFQAANPAPVEPDKCELWGDISRRAASTNVSIAILGVMLEGGSLPEQREVRQRLRYAVELALTTAEVGPEDQTHIATNAVNLRLGAGTVSPSRFAYEWFRDHYSTNCQACVMWLNEDDFAEDPAQGLDSLLGQIPYLTSGKTNVSFYLIGPRSSGTLRNFQEELGTVSTNHILVAAAKRGNFHILSPEATASLLPPSLVFDPNRAGLKRDFDGAFGADVFHNWITTDRRLAELITRELANRQAGPSNVFVILTEQDTHFGAVLADEWIESLTNKSFGIGTSDTQIWQFAYLRGLDGSKPPREKPADPPSLTALAISPESALDRVLDQQRTGVRADGDAQVDYLTRLGEFLNKKDQEFKSQGSGRIAAVGLAASDAYDKLVLLKEFRRQLPDAVFFTTDLDASLWTANALPYARNLLVASAYPLEPNVASNAPPAYEEFAPFRDVYQAAVFRACNAVAIRLFNPTDGLEPKTSSPGSLYKIGWHGPVPLSIPDDSPSRMTSTAWDRWLAALLGLAILGLMAVAFIALSSGGFAWRVETSDDGEAPRPIPYNWLATVPKLVVLSGIVGSAIFLYARKIAASPFEEPWDFSGGVSIWPAEFLRVFAMFGGGVFLVDAYRRHMRHRERLWLNYFREHDDVAPFNWQDFWNATRSGWAKPQGPQAETALERRNWFTSLWRPPLTGSEDRPSVDAVAVFRRYLRLGTVGFRAQRLCVGAIVHALALWLFIYAMGDLPTHLFIRGKESYAFHHWLQIFSWGVGLAVLFYVLDASVLAGTLLGCLSRHRTRWPDLALVKHGERFGIGAQHLDGQVDVEFAAEHTREIQSLMFGPIIFLLILIVSRSYFLESYWSPGRVLIFGANFAVVAAAWWLVRRAAQELRKSALEHLDEAIAAARNSGPTAANELRGLKRVRKAIREEQRGAYARWFQDPTYLAVGIPSGGFGLVSLLAALWWKH